MEIKGHNIKQINTLGLALVITHTLTQTVLGGALSTSPDFVLLKSI